MMEKYKIKCGENGSVKRILNSPPQINGYIFAIVEIHGFPIYRMLD